MNILELYAIIRSILYASKDLTDLTNRIRDQTKNDPDLLNEAKQDDKSAVSRALHRLHQGDGTAPRIALVGETSTGKTMLVNTLFGEKLGDEKLTADTTSWVLRAKFPSNLVIYDTPGVFGDEKLENKTRLFIGLKQCFDEKTHVDRVPFQQNHKYKKIIELPREDIGDYPIDLVLWTINISKPLTRSTKNDHKSFFSELEKKYRGQLIVAGTHLDVLNKVTPEEKQEMLRTWNEISNNQIIPVSSETGEGLSDLVVELFKRLPGDVSLSKMQESLNEVKKIDRLSFIITEISHPLADIILMTADEQEEIKIYILILITMLCHHYSVNEKTWVRLHGNSQEIARLVQESSTTTERVERPPRGIWEHIKSWFGEVYFRTVTEYQQLGVEGLSELLVDFYEMIHKFERSENPPLTHNEIYQKVRAHRKALNPLIRAENTAKLAPHINNLLRSLLHKELK